MMREIWNAMEGGSCWPMDIRSNIIWNSRSPLFWNKVSLRQARSSAIIEHSNASRPNKSYLLSQLSEMLFGLGLHVGRVDLSPMTRHMQSLPRGLAHWKVPISFIYFCIIDMQSNIALRSDKSYGIAFVRQTLSHFYLIEFAQYLIQMRCQRLHYIIYVICVFYQSCPDLRWFFRPFWAVLFPVYPCSQFGQPSHKNYSWKTAFTSLNHY